jgi:hypothetical protein
MAGLVLPANRSPQAHFPAAVPRLRCAAEPAPIIMMSEEQPPDQQRITPQSRTAHQTRA